MSAGRDELLVATRRAGPSAIDGVGARTFEDISALRHETLTTVTFPDHVHEQHQLMIGRRGSAVVTSLTGAWTIGPGTAVWMPAGSTHAMTVAPPATFLSLYIDPQLMPSEDRWTSSHAIGIDTLLAELVERLGRHDLTDAHRGRCAALVIDLLESSPISDSSLPIPRGDRAGVIAAAIMANPGDPRELADWSAELGVSTRTLTRDFRAETTLSFTDWRTRARVAASLTPLREGQRINDIATEVGYANPSTFIVAFRSILGLTPGEYARAARQTSPSSLTTSTRSRNRG